MANETSVGKRLLIAAAWFIGAGVLTGGVWLFGMLMFAFSGDSTNPNNLPGWLEPAMLIGWPCVLAMTAFVPPFLYAIGVNKQTAIRGLWAGVFSSMASYLAGWVTLVAHS